MKLSDKLKEYIRKHGNIISIGIFYQIQGWWHAIESLSGRMVFPENKNLFKEFDIEDMKIFVEKKLLDEKNRVIEFLMVSEGYYEICLEQDDFT